MNENLDLTKILNGCPKGTKLYSPIFGEVELYRVKNVRLYPIDVTLDDGSRNHFSADGRYYLAYENAECLLFPSKEQRDWSKFERFWDKHRKNRFDPKTFKAFDKVLARIPGDDKCPWMANFIRLPEIKGIQPQTLLFGLGSNIIPYNEDTEYLLGTSEDCPEYYKWWED